MPYVDDMVIVDMESDDCTRDVLEELGVRVLEGKWIPGGGDHKCLDLAYAMHTECIYDMILHFEADEVYPQSLLEKINQEIQHGVQQISVLRLQVEQNFQRIRQNLLPVHRVFEKGSTIGCRAGHTTTMESQLLLISGDNGYLWDCTNDFRDNYLTRVEQNAELHGGQPNYLMVSQHCIERVYLSRAEAMERLKEPHWLYKSTPLAIPRILRPLLGVTKYE
jgi:hypothetical protein